MRAVLSFVCVIPFLVLSSQATTPAPAPVLNAPGDAVASSPRTPNATPVQATPTNATPVQAMPANDVPASPMECRFCMGPLDENSPNTLKCCVIPNHHYHVDCHAEWQRNAFTKDSSFCELCKCADRIAMNTPQQARFDGVFAPVPANNDAEVTPGEIEQAFLREYDYLTFSPEHDNLTDEEEEEEQDEDIASTAQPQEIPTPLGWPVGFVPRQRGVVSNHGNEMVEAGPRNLFHAYEASP